jgi:hypothetical protein
MWSVSEVRYWRRILRTRISLVKGLSVRRRGAADFFGKATTPPFGVLDRLHRLGQFSGHRNGMTIRLEHPLELVIRRQSASSSLCAPMHDLIACRQAVVSPVGGG